MKRRKASVRMRQCVEHLRAAVAGVLASKITVQAGRDCWAKRRDECAKPATIRLELGMLGRMFTLAYRADLVPRRPPFEMPEVNNTRTGFFVEAEVRTVIEHLPDPCDLSSCSFSTPAGDRGEAQTLKWSHVDWCGRMLRLEASMTKTSRARVAVRRDAAVRRSAR